MDSNELLYGRIGYVYSLLFVYKHLSDLIQNNSGQLGIPVETIEIWKMLPDVILKAAQKVILEGKTKSDRNVPEHLMYEWHNKKYLGAAHGVSGILFVLLLASQQFPALLNQHKQILLNSLDILYDLNAKTPTGNYPSRFESRNDELCQWCHGAVGFVYLYSKAYEVGIDIFDTLGNKTVFFLISSKNKF